MVFLVLVSSALAVKTDVNFDGGDKVSVIVILKEKPVKQMNVLSVEDKKDFLAEKRAGVKEQQDKVLGKLEKGFSVAGKDEKFKRFSTVSGFAGEITQEEFELLKNDPDVEGIFLDKVYTIDLDGSAVIINSTLANAMVQNYSVSLTGAGLTACVVDTGIDYNHNALGGGWGNRVLGGYDFVNGDADPADDHGHGTHVAGILGSNDSTYQGVAPDVDFVAVKVCNSSGGCDGSDMLSGIDWCNNYSTTYNITVISMSIGDNDDHNASDCPTDFDSAINTAVSLGMTFVAASGNNGLKTGISSPACSPNATSVGATNKDDTIWSSTNSGVLLDLFAPGALIRSTYPNNAFATISGTSMATPHVSGAVVLLNQYKQLIDNTTYTSAEIETILKSTGVNKTDTNNITAPRINIYDALLSEDNVTPAASYISPTPTNGSNIGHLNTTTVKINSSESVNAILEFDGTNYSMSLINNAVYQVNVTPITGGTHTFKVYYNDLAGNAGIVLDTRTLEVNNSAPNITAYTPSTTNLSLAEGNSLFFNQTSSDPENDTLTYAWYLNNSLQANTSSWNYTAGYDDAGNHTVTLVVFDSFNDSDSRSWNLIVNNTNRAPIANILSPSNSSTLEIGSSTAFTTNSSDDDGNNLTYLWDFGDSGTNTSANATHTYLSVNNFTVVLTVNDTALTDNHSIVVEVEDTTDPSYNSVTYSSSIYAGEDLSVSANITDYSTITNVTLLYNGTVRTPSQSGDVYSWTLDEPSNGSNTFYIYAADNYSNSDNNSYAFTVNYCGDSTCQSADESCSICSADCGTCSSGSSSGGGGGTAAVALPSKIFFYGTTDPGTDYKLSFGSSDMPFTEATFRPNAIKTNVQIKVAVTESPPKTLSDVYKYLQITLTNIAENELTADYVKFKVNKTWLDENNYDHTKISLYRYEGGNWNKLNTMLTNEGLSDYYYYADVPGFSYFGIAAEKKVEIAPAAVAEPEPVSETYAIQGAEETPEAVAAPAAVNETHEDEAVSAWYLLLLIPAALIIFLVVYFTKYKKPEKFLNSLFGKKGEVVEKIEKPEAPKREEIIQHIVKEHQDDLTENRFNQENF
ncbi:S8 family serine peptidase [Candidatus Woesearchaeota archaeon]|nr:S8 family serine peptidase [Candidatus Woesearchaeota archaeon]